MVLLCLKTRWFQLIYTSVCYHIIILKKLYCYSLLIIYNVFFCQDNLSDKDVNQGTVVIYNLDSSVSNDELGRIFGVYGEVKEVRLIL